MAVSLIGRLLYQPFYAHYLTRTQLTHKSITFPLSPIEAYDSIAGLRIGVWVAAVIGVALCGISLVRAQKKHTAVYRSARVYQRLSADHRGRVYAALCVLLHSYLTEDVMSKTAHYAAAFNVLGICYLFPPDDDSNRAAMRLFTLRDLHSSGRVRWTIHCVHN